MRKEKQSVKRRRKGRKRGASRLKRKKSFGKEEKDKR